MTIQFEQKNKAVHLIAMNDDGHEAHLDGSESIGGEGKGFRPMQMLLVGLGACTSMDVISVLNKQKQEMNSYNLDVQGFRTSEEIPAVFQHIHVLFKVNGPVLEEKLVRAIYLSITKYCSVTRMLEGTTKISSAYILNGGKEITVATVGPKYLAPKSED
ncbi:MAG: osmotically inducible protein OsmC [Balneola sp.]|nr:osmotically inducible protein OsmC [Balneola sp.]|tara:strand:+ start:1041 stop:1517 length:477 start_codon:yes stop_codon:yes gene_type:complete